MNVLRSLISTALPWILWLLLCLSVLVVGCLSLGCASPLRDGSTRLKVVTKDGLTIEYQSPKDQFVEYDPESGKLTARSTSNPALVESATTAQANALEAMAQAVSSVVAPAK
jgi:hypothetical protein